MSMSDYATNTEELKAAYERIDELEAALLTARTHLITLGGDARRDIADGLFYGDMMQAVVLDHIDGALVSELAQ